MPGTSPIIPSSNEEHERFLVERMKPEDTYKYEYHQWLSEDSKNIYKKKRDIYIARTTPKEELALLINKIWKSKKAEEIFKQRIALNG